MALVWGHPVRTLAGHSARPAERSRVAAASRAGERCQQLVHERMQA